MRNDLDSAIAEEIEASRTTYTLAFYLADNERDNAFHALTVHADRSGLQLFYRQGYYAGNTDLPDTPKGKGELEASLLNQVSETAVGITARVDQPRHPARHRQHSYSIWDPATLVLTGKTGGWTGHIEETFVELNASGATLSKASDTKEFQVTRESRARYDSQGIAWPQSLPLIAGATKITIVVRDSKSGRVGSLTVPLM